MQKVEVHQASCSMTLYHYNVMRSIFEVPVNNKACIFLVAKNCNQVPFTLNNGRFSLHGVLCDLGENKRLIKDFSIKGHLYIIHYLKGEEHHRKD